MIKYNNLDLMYKESLNALKRYINEHNKTITEIEWNRIAFREGYLSSESIGFMSEIHFNKLCKKILKDKDLE